jgi:protein-L-isoaspartate O-methyltransferase
LNEDRADAWVASLLRRHTRDWSRTEFLKATRALSARYVERRAPLPHAAPANSAAKRAAFAAFFAPIHFFTTREIVRRLGASDVSLERIIDLGAGTGAASAAWALECGSRPTIVGVERERWALDEARMTWRDLGLHGSATRGDLVAVVESLGRPGRQALAPRTGLLLAWSVNELPADARRRLLPALRMLTDRGAALLVIEPIARRVSPWWDEWAAALAGADGRVDDWKLDVPLPAPLAELDESAGFRRDGLTARSLWRSGATRTSGVFLRET